MRDISARYACEARPIRVLQYGEGNFARAFADWMIDIMNERGLFDGGVAIVKPRGGGALEAFERQNNLYSALLRGEEDGQSVCRRRVIRCVQAAINPYLEYARYAALARLDTLRFVISNTTESGIVFDPDDRFELEPPRSYPGKLTRLLYERALHFDYAPERGLIILPLELIEDNGAQLKRCVLRLAARWNLGARFARWVEEGCVFASTLVDRIVSGYPAREAESLAAQAGYEDRLLVCAEPYALWAIQSPRDISDEFPVHRAGVGAVYAPDLAPYRLRKLYILNAAHTSFALAAYLSGHNTVLEAMRDELYARFVRGAIMEEIIPTLPLPREDLESYARSVKLRFLNPYVEHRLLSISLNSLSKYRARLLPTLIKYARANGRPPRRVAFSLAALAAFYRGARMENGALTALRGKEEYRVEDERAVLEFFLAHASDSPRALTCALLSRVDFWGEDLNAVAGLAGCVSGALEDIDCLGMTAALEKLEGVSSRV